MGAENGEGNAANGTSAETPPQAQGYVPRAAHPMLSKKNTGDEEKKEASPEQDAPSNLEPTEKNDAETVEKDEVGNSQPEPEIEKGQEKKDASTKEWYLLVKIYKRKVTRMSRYALFEVEKCLCSLFL